MGKTPTRRNFAQMVSELPETTKDVEPARVASLDGDTLVDESGREFNCVDEDLPNARVWELAQAGAGVVIDPCGCGGGCGLMWLSTEDVKGLVREGPPRHNRKSGSFSLWETDDGATYLLGDGGVRWGDLDIRGFLQPQAIDEDLRPSAT